MLPLSIKPRKYISFSISFLSLVRPILYRIRIVKPNKTNRLMTVLKTLLNICISPKNSIYRKTTSQQHTQIQPNRCIHITNEYTAFNMQIKFRFRCVFFFYLWKVFDVSKYRNKLSTIGAAFLELNNKEKLKQRSEIERATFVKWEKKERQRSKRSNQIYLNKMLINRTKDLSLV